LQSGWWCILVLYSSWYVLLEQLAAWAKPH
jgi:hypothetical protein